MARKHKPEPPKRKLAGWCVAGLFLISGAYLMGRTGTASSNTDGLPAPVPKLEKRSAEPTPDVQDNGRRGRTRVSARRGDRRRAGIRRDHGNREDDRRRAGRSRGGQRQQRARRGPPPRVVIPNL